MFSLHPPTPGESRHTHTLLCTTQRKKRKKKTLICIDISELKTLNVEDNWKAMGQLSPKTCWLASYFPPRKRHLLCVCLSPTTVHRNLSFFYFFLPEIYPPFHSANLFQVGRKRRWKEQLRRVRSKLGRIFNPFYDCYSSVSPDSLSFIFSQWNTHVHTAQRWFHCD